VIGQKIKALALGGCGDMGRYAVQTALDFDFIDQIVIAALLPGCQKQLQCVCGSP
jgi:hypothetical protein